MQIFLFCPCFFKASDIIRNKCSFRKLLISGKNENFNNSAIITQNTSQNPNFFKMVCLYKNTTQILFNSKINVMLIILNFKVQKEF